MGRKQNKFIILVTDFLRPKKSTYIKIKIFSSKDILRQVKKQREEKFATDKKYI